MPLWLLAAAVALAAVAVGLRLLERRRLRRVERFARHDLAERLMSGYDARRRKPLGVLTVAGFALLFLALFQPRFGEAWRDVGRASRDIVVVLDTSESMRAENPLPSRIERARQEVASLIDRASGDRFALIAFSGAAALQCPLTLDHGYVKAVLNAIDTNTISQEGTNIAAALVEARALLEEERENDARYDRDARAVLLISDGEQVEGNAVEEAHRLGDLARVFVVGVGDPKGTPIEVPRWMAPYRARLPGSGTHVSKLDEANLERVALSGNGAYARSQVDNWGIMQLYERFRALSARDVSGEVRMQLVNRYQWFLAAAILCFVAEAVWLLLLPRFRRRDPSPARRSGANETAAARRSSSVRAALLAALIVASADAALAQSFDERLEKANALLRSGAVEEAATLYRELQVERPESELLELALGCAQYDAAMALPEDAPPEAAEARLREALSLFDKAGASERPEVRRRAAFNRANTLARVALRQGDSQQRDAALEGFQEAIDAYEDLLEHDPGHEGARQNLDYVRYRLKEMLQNPPPPPEEEQQQQNQQQDDQSGEQQDQEQEPPQEEQQQGQQQQQQAERSGQPEDEQQQQQQPRPSGEDQEASPDEERQAGDQQEPQEIDRQTVEAILRSLEEVDQQEQQRLRAGPRDDRLRTEWW